MSYRYHQRRQHQEESIASARSAQVLHQLEDFVHTEVDRGRDTEESIDIDVDMDAGIEADTGIDIAAVDNDSFQTDRAGAWQ